MLVLSEIIDMWELVVIKLPNHLPCHKMADQKCIIFEQKVHFSTSNTKISNDMLLSAFLIYCYTKNMLKGAHTRVVCNVYLNGVLVEQVDSVKYLGHILTMSRA